MEIRTFGGGERLRACEAVLKECKEFEDTRLLLLPIPTARDKKYITDTDVALCEIPTLIARGECVAGYGIPNEIKERIIERGGRVYDGALDGELLLKNADLTAKGTVGYLMTHTEREPSELVVGVVGYGRIGVLLVRYLLFLGAKVKVYTRRYELARELCESLIDAEVVSENADFSEIDLLINTAPASLFSHESIEALLSHGEIYDLASGKIFENYAKAVRLPSLPGRMYPKSAGRIYAEQIIKWLSEGEK